MEKTLMGVIEVDPKNILEDGIRKELLNLLAINFNKIIDFSSNANIDFLAKLNELAKRISCIKRSFIFIQDYININGVRMWNEEMHRMLNYYVDLEANRFLPRKIRLDSKYDLQKYPIPRFLPVHKDTDSYTFMGRLVRYIINVTKPKSALYYPSTFTWYDVYSKEIIGIKTFNLIKQSMGIEGLQGLYRLLGYFNFQQIYNLKNVYTKFISDKNFSKNLKQLATILNNPCILEYSEKDVNKNLFSIISSISKYLSATFTNIILNLGHVEILKLLVSHCLKESAEVDSHVLNSQIGNLNKVNMQMLKSFIELKFMKEEESPTSPNTFNTQSNNNSDPPLNDRQKEAKYFKLLCELFEDFGLVDSSKTFYYNLSSLEHMVMILAMVSYNEMINCFAVDKKSGVVSKKYKNDDFEFYYFIYGIFIILYQMGRNNVIFFISFLSHLIKQHLVNQYFLKDYKSMFDKYPEIPNQIILMQLFLQELANTFEVDISSFELCLNRYFLSKSISS
jgi:hypothetical protein